MHYRPEIDGLRAIAVLAVIFSHVGIEAFAGGFVGVDVFFVISGYLITSIILRDIEAGKFSLLHFYERRAKRILPALFFVLLCTVILAWYILLPTEFRNFAKTLIASTLSVSNFYFMLTTDYFAPEASNIPLLHTWSLAVEEQFYLIFPLFLVFLARKKRIVFGLWLAVIVSFVVGCVFAVTHPLAAYYLLPARAWELLAGSVLALLCRSSFCRPNTIIAFVGLILIGLAIYLFDADTITPSVYTLAPVIGAALFIRFSKEGALSSLGLSHWALVSIGKVSFSAYLWHQPVLVFARHLGWATDIWDVQVALVLLIFALATLTYFFVEVPFRKSHQAGFPVVDFVLRGGAILVFFGVWGLLDKGLPLRGGLSYALVLEENRGWSKTCIRSGSDIERPVPDNKCNFGPDTNSRIAIWGDSIAGSITPSVVNLSAARGYRVEQYTLAGCMPVVNVARGPKHASAKCLDYNRSVLEYLVAEDIEVVVMFGSWVNSFRFDAVTIGDREYSPSTLGEPFVRELNETVAALTASGKDVYIVMPMFDGEQEVAATVHRALWFGKSDPSFRVSYVDFAANTEFASSLLATATLSGATLLQIKDVFCELGASGDCALSNRHIPYLADRRHFTQAGADKLAASIIDRILPK